MKKIKKNIEKEKEKEKEKNRLRKNEKIRKILRREEVRERA